jgi:hypothetical protein
VYQKLDKAVVGRKLSAKKTEILAKSSINRKLAIPFFLCLEDVIENCQLDAVRKYQTILQDREINLIIHRYIFAKLYRD